MKRCRCVPAWTFSLPLAVSPSFVPVRRPQSRRQFLFQHGNVGSGPVISLARTLARNIGRGDDVDLVAQVIERQQAVEEHQHAIGQREIVFGMLADIFQLPDHVVSEISDGARGKRRQPGHSRRTMLPQQFLHDLNRASLTLFLLLAALHYDLAAPRPHLHIGTRSQKRVASDLLAALHRLQQESIGSLAAMARKAETGVNKSAATDFTTGTSVASPASRENSL